MDLNLNKSLANDYSSKSQIARVLTESWVLNNSYCPSCGDPYLREFENNKPVADFYCVNCREEFELKSRKGGLTLRVLDGAYSTMLDRINSDNNPNFFFLTYSKDFIVSNFLIIPKQFFTPEVIIKRPPLAPTARRAGWVGCIIDISKVAELGKIYLVENFKVLPRDIVKEKFRRTMFLRSKTLKGKTWVLEVLSCIEQIESDYFTLDEVYKFEEKLKLKYPNNNFIKDKIRQQLQVLRDKGYIEFVGRGKYRKIIF